MVIVPASAAMPEGLTFTVGQITWTTHGDGLTTTVLEGTQIQSGTSVASAPTTRMLAQAPDHRSRATREGRSTARIFSEHLIALIPSYSKLPN